MVSFFSTTASRLMVCSLGTAYAASRSMAATRSRGSSASMSEAKVSEL